MVEELYHASDRSIELISPTSVTEILELNDLIKGNNEHRECLNAQNQKNTLEMFVCVTDADGTIRYSNFGLDCTNKFGKNNIITLLHINSPKIHEKIFEIKQDNSTYNDAMIKTLLNGHICFVTLNDLKIPVILKLQQAMDNEKLLIWLFKKASITEVSEKGFEIDGNQEKQYKFTKFKFILAVDRLGRLINAPDDLVKTLLGRNFLYKPRKVDELIEIPDDLKQVMESYENRDGDFYGKFSASSIDLAVDESSSNISVIYRAKAILKGSPIFYVTINLFNYIYTSENEPVFPLQVKYQSENDEEKSIILDEDETFPEFRGFKVIRKISESVHSSVYEAVQIYQPDHHVVIKVIHSADHVKIPAEIKFYEFFLNEPKGCEFIERPLNVETGTRPTIFMNCSTNQIDLFDFIQSNSYLPDSCIQVIFRQIASAIDYLHENGIVHRDIKDENVLIDPMSLNVKLIDFGSSAFLNDNETKFTEYIGTFAYAPVEVLKGRPFNGPEQDIWCLGILLYILCFKEAPFHSPKEILQGFLRLPKERPSNCIQLIRKMLDPNPQNRPTIKEVLNSEFLN